MQVAIERCFRSTKHSRSLTRHQFPGIAKASPHIRMSWLAYFATVLA